MRSNLLVVPTRLGAGLTSISLGLLRALQRAGFEAGFCKPIEQLPPGQPGPERSTALARNSGAPLPPEPIALAEAERLLSAGDEQVLLERVVEVANQLPDTCEVAVIEGLTPRSDTPFAENLNAALARTLDARVVLVADAISTPQEVAESLAILARSHGGAGKRGRVLGCVLNRVEVPAAGSIELGEASVAQESLRQAAQPWRTAIEARGLRVLGVVPVQPLLGAPRMADVSRHLGARVLHAGDLGKRRMALARVVARTVPNALGALRSGFLVITPGDREDILLAAGLASVGGQKLAGLLLTGGLTPHPQVWELCRPALATGLPVLQVEGDTYDTATAVRDMDREVPFDDRERAEWVMNTVASHLDIDAIKAAAKPPAEQRLSPPAFRQRLIEQARAADCRIVLPEGDEPRTLAAAAICARRGIARCVLLGQPDRIRDAARQAGVELPNNGIEIIDHLQGVPALVPPMVEARRHKGLNEAMAAEQLTDTVVYGTMMLHLDQVDGLVSGAVHTTAHTIRPALQLIKTAPGCDLVSSVFFMCLPEQVVVYGDCAVNPDPTPTQLADIALQSAASARAFGIPARVAMLSYSTGESGSGNDVEKVREATRIARERDPQLAIDGPLQYDAAAILEVGQQKAPGSPVAGRATVFIFPDLNTGNTTYKAVQRSAGVISIGPMLQGLAKPVNDLSRGALVEDIVYTIALTAIQAASRRR